MKKILLVILTFLLTSCEKEVDFRIDLERKLLDSGWEYTDEIESRVVDAKHFTYVEFQNEYKNLVTYIFNLKTGTLTKVTYETISIDERNYLDKKVESFIPFSRSGSIEVRNSDDDNCFIDTEINPDKVKIGFQEVGECTLDNVNVFLDQDLQFVLDILELSYDEYIELFKY